MLLYNASFLVLTLNPFIHASNLFRYFAKENNSNRDYIDSFLPKGASISRIRCWYSSNVSCLYFSLSSFGIATQMNLYPFVTYQQQKTRGFLLRMQRSHQIMKSQSIFTSSFSNTLSNPCSDQIFPNSNPYIPHWLGRARLALSCFCASLLNPLSQLLS